MYKIGIIGDKDSTLGFLALGLDIFPVHEADEVKKTLVNLVEENYAIIYICEHEALIAKDIIDRYKDSSLPAIIVIPGIKGNMGIGLQEIRESAKRAVGIDILF